MHQPGSAWIVSYAVCYAYLMCLGMSYVYSSVSKLIYLEISIERLEFWAWSISFRHREMSQRALLLKKWWLDIRICLLALVSQVIQVENDERPFSSNETISWFRLGKMSKLEVCKSFDISWCIIYSHFKVFFPSISVSWSVEVWWNPTFVIKSPT